MLYVDKHMSPNWLVRTCACRLLGARPSLEPTTKPRPTDSQRSRGLVLLQDMGCPIRFVCHVGLRYFQRLWYCCTIKISSEVNSYDSAAWIALGVSGSPIERQWSSRRYPGGLGLINTFIVLVVSPITWSLTAHRAVNGGRELCGLVQPACNEHS